MCRDYQNQLFADRRTSFSQRGLGKSVYCYLSKFARFGKISSTPKVGCRIYSTIPSNHEGTKDMKGFNTFTFKLRALRDLRGKSSFFFFGCGPAALCLCGEISMRVRLE